MFKRMHARMILMYRYIKCTPTSSQLLRRLPHPPLQFIKYAMWKHNIFISNGNGGGAAIRITASKKPTCSQNVLRRQTFRFYFIFIYVCFQFCFCLLFNITFVCVCVCDCKCAARNGRKSRDKLVFFIVVS